MPVRLALFPGVGSFGAEFQPLIRRLGPGAGRVVRYPGRVGRDLGIPAASFGDLVDACVADVARWAAPGVVLLGHSFGAWVAYATATALGPRGISPGALVVAGAAGPSRLRVPDRELRSAQGIAAYLSAIDPGLLDRVPDPQLRDVVIDTARQDLDLLAGFRAADHPLVDCPVLAGVGEADPLADEISVRAWAETTTGTFVWRTFPRGHADLLGDPAFVEEVTALAARTTTG
ncbi:MAG TPA: alpha/beta fold hydrolase [Kineosporiaceae bacterium]